jgi:hypothetical protein
MHHTWSPLVRALLAFALVACDPSSESSLEVENSTSYELLVTTESSEGLVTIPIPVGETVEVKHILDIGPPRPPTFLRGLSADIVRREQRVAAYTQKPIDSHLWEQRIWPPPCDANACGVYVLVLTDDDLQLP